MLLAGKCAVRTCASGKYSKQCEPNEHLRSHTVAVHDNNAQHRIISLVSSFCLCSKLYDLDTCPDCT